MRFRKEEVLRMYDELTEVDIQKMQEDAAASDDEE